MVVGYGGEKALRQRPEGDGTLGFLDSTGQKAGDIALGAHPESFQLEKTGTRVFVNVPDKKEIQVADVVKGITLARWPVTTATSNFPMALDEAHHRLFSGTRLPPRLPVLDTESGKIGSSFRICPVLGTIDVLPSATHIGCESRSNGPAGDTPLELGRDQRSQTGVNRASAREDVHYANGSK